MENECNITHKASENPKVSVIVPVYKVEFYLARCLTSICNQTLEDIEIIIVDEGTMDQDRVITDEFMSHDKRIVAIHEGGGYGVCVNAGIEAAKGEYIGIVESDDFIEPDMYEKLYTHAKEIDADIVKSPFFQYYDDNNDNLAPMMNELLYQLPTDRCFTLDQYPIMLSTHPSIWAGVYKTSWLRNSGIVFRNKGAYLDIVFRFKTLRAAKRIGWINIPTYHWRISNPTSTNATWNLNAAIERWEEILGLLEDEKDTFEKYEPYLIPEAQKNLFGQFDILTRTRTQRKKVKELRKVFSDKAIKKSMYIGEDERIDFLNGNLDILCIKRYLNSILLFLIHQDFQRVLLTLWLSLLAFAFFVKGTDSPLAFLSRPFGTIASVLAILYWIELVLWIGLSWSKELLHRLRKKKK